jgi:hypothetical protein
MTFSSYQDFRHQVLSLMGSARHRIWLTSRFLSDSDIILGLYMARYRKVDIRIGVGESQANHPLSRYHELAEEGLFVQKLPLDGQGSSPSSLIIDNQAYRFNTVLHPFVQQRRFSIQPVALPANLSIAMDNRDKIEVKKPPGEFERGVMQLSEPKTSARPLASASILRSEVYDYTNRRSKKPKNVETRLPKNVKWRKDSKRQE